MIKYQHQDSNLVKYSPINLLLHETSHSYLSWSFALLVVLNVLIHVYHHKVNYYITCYVILILIYNINNNK